MCWCRDVQREAWSAWDHIAMAPAIQRERPAWGEPSASRGAISLDIFVMDCFPRARAHSRHHPLDRNQLDKEQDAKLRRMLRDAFEQGLI